MWSGQHNLSTWSPLQLLCLSKSVFVLGGFQIRMCQDEILHQRHRKYPHTHSGSQRTVLNICPFKSPVQANWKPDLQAATGKVRMLGIQCMQTRSKGDQGLGISACLLCAEPEGTPARNNCAPIENSVLCGPRGLTAEPHQLPELGDLAASPSACSHRRWRARHVEKLETWLHGRVSYWKKTQEVATGLLSPPDGG